MDNIIGIVVNSETKQGDRKDGKGKWTRYAFQLKDTGGNVEWYSCFDKTAQEVEVGQAYEFAYELNGDYKNLSTWMTVDADAHGLSMSTPVVDTQAEFRRSKVEMRWAEAYHMATRVVGPQKILAEANKEVLIEWAEFFYAKLEGCGGVEPTSTITVDDTHTEYLKSVEAPIKVETPTSTTGVSKASPKKGRPSKKVVEAPEPIDTAPDYNLLKAFNDARVAADMSMGDVNEYTAGRFDIDSVRKLSEDQIKNLISYIEELNE